MRARSKLLRSAAWTGAWTESTTSDASGKAFPGKVTRSEFISTPHGKSYRPLASLFALSPQFPVRHTLGLYTSRQFAKRKSPPRVAEFFSAQPSESKEAIAISFQLGALSFQQSS